MLRECKGCRSRWRPFPGVVVPSVLTRQSTLSLQLRLENLRFQEDRLQHAEQLVPQATKELRMMNSEIQLRVLGLGQDPPRLNIYIYVCMYICMYVYMYITLYVIF